MHSSTKNSWPNRLKKIGCNTTISAITSALSRASSPPTSSRRCWKAGRSQPPSLRRKRNERSHFVSVKSSENLCRQNVEQLLEIRLLRIIRIAAEIRIEPDAGGAGESDARQHQRQIALQMPLLGPENHFHFQNRGHIGVLALGAENVQQVLQNPR